MSEAGKTIIYTILLFIMFIVLFLAPAAVGMGELADRHRTETGEGR